MLLRLLIRRRRTLCGEFQRGVNVGGLLERHAQGRKNRLGGEELQLLFGDVLLGGLHEHQILQTGESVEQVVVALPKNLAQILVVHGAEVRLGPGFAHEVENLRGGQIGAAPKVELRRDLQLLATCFQGPHDRVGVVRVDLVGRRLAAARVLVELLEVLAQGVAQTLEFLGALVGTTELESVPGGLVVDLLEPDVGLQHIQHHLVGVPQKAEVHVDIAVLALLTGVIGLNGSQEDCLRSFHLVQVAHLLHVQVLSLFRLTDLLLCGLAELLDD
mmetsp:Transcript_89385/g.257818  ORF Transcript_89385/g.257818 Transcript_89385/m.257818 type:complete len:273 (-) Transcript_89385:458-1276(-)